MFARIPVASIVMVGSVAVHTAVFLGMPGARQLAGSQPAAPAEIEVAVASIEAPSALVEERDAPPLGAGGADAPGAVGAADTTDAVDAKEATARSRVEPVARSRSRPPSPPAVQAAPGMNGAASSLPRSLPEDAASSTPLRFAMTVGPASVASAGSAPLGSVGPAASAPLGPVAAASLGSVGSAAASSGDANDSHGEAVFGEDGVDARPRLLAWQAPHYPPSAASAGVEVDVPVDVVIDTVGLVTDVRLPKHFGYGLDEAAIATARSYRFTRGLKDGRAVRVRMRCTVMFRLN
jgi:TonB family protein